MLKYSEGNKQHMDSNTIKTLRKFVKKTLDNLRLMSKDIEYFFDQKLIVAVDTEEIIDFVLNRNTLSWYLTDEEKNKRKISSIAQTYVLFNRDENLNSDKNFQFNDVVLLPPYADELRDLLWYWREDLENLSNPGGINHFIKDIVNSAPFQLIFKDIKAETNKGNKKLSKNMIGKFVEFLRSDFNNFYLAVTGSVRITFGIVRELLGIDEEAKEHPLSFAEESAKDWNIEDEFKREIMGNIRKQYIRTDETILDIAKLFSEIPRRKDADIANLRDAMAVYLVSKFNKVSEDKRMILFSDAESVETINKERSGSSNKDLEEILSKFEFRKSSYFITFLTMLENNKDETQERIKTMKSRFTYYLSHLDFYINPDKSISKNILNPWKCSKSNNDTNKGLNEISKKETPEELFSKIECNVKKIIDQQNEISTPSKESLDLSVEDKTKQTLSSLINAFNNILPINYKRKIKPEEISEINSQISQIVENDMYSIENMYNNFNNLKFIYHRDRFLKFYEEKLGKENGGKTEELIKKLLKTLMSDDYKKYIDELLRKEIKHDAEEVKGIAEKVLSAFSEALLHSTPEIITNKNKANNLKINFRRLSGYPWQIKFEDKYYKEEVDKFIKTINNSKSSKDNLKNSFENLVNLAIQGNKDNTKENEKSHERYLLGASILFGLMEYRQAYMLLHDFLKYTIEEKDRYNDKYLEFIVLEFLTLRKEILKKMYSCNKGNKLAQLFSFYKKFLELKKKYWNANNNDIEKMDPRILNIVAITMYDVINNSYLKEQINKEWTWETSIKLLEDILNSLKKDEKQSKIFKAILLNNMVYINIQEGAYKEYKDKEKSELNKDYNNLIESLLEFSEPQTTNNKKEANKHKNTNIEASLETLLKIMEQGKPPFQILYEIPETLAEIECYRSPVEYNKNAKVKSRPDLGKRFFAQYKKIIKNIEMPYCKDIHGYKYEELCKKIEKIKETHLAKKNGV